MDHSNTILVIDDDVQLRSVLRRVLVRSGYLVHEAGNGREGLAVLANTAVQVVITDIIMPDMEGIELILELRRTRPGQRVIAMSAGGRIRPESHLCLAKHSGATRTIAKPFDLEVFVDLVRDVAGAPEITPG